MQINAANLLRKLERAKGFEPSTPTLARLCSTPELRPLGAGPELLGAGKVAASSSEVAPPQGLKRLGEKSASAHIGVFFKTPRGE